MAATALFGPVAAAPALAQPITAEAIETATFADWQARTRHAEAIAAAAESDPTTPNPEPAAPGEGAIPPVGEADGPGESADVAVTGMPEAVVETPAYSTDIPDQAGLVSYGDGPDPFIIRLQVLLGRAHASPGVIDGHDGGNTEKAIRVYEAMRGLPVDGRPDSEMWTVLAVDTGSAMTTYTTTAEDIDGRYVASIPSDFGAMAELDWLGYSGPAEMLAERFHMDEDLLRALNPQANFESPGETITVVDTGSAAAGEVTRITVDKTAGLLEAFGRDGEIVFAAPATVGSGDNPSPTGTLTVNGVAPEPTYSYRPDVNFRQEGNDRELTIAPGPRGPVGSIWIDLSKPTYGIHGTPEPALIDKTSSHGCVRLTNWDAEELSTLLVPNETVVEFLP